MTKTTLKSTVLLLPLLAACGGSEPPAARSATASPSEVSYAPPSIPAPIAPADARADGDGAPSAFGAARIGSVAPPSPPPGGGAVATSAGVKAGEWDDNANYREYLRYLEAQQLPQLHRQDLSARQFIVVRDAEGKPEPRCEVAIKEDGGKEIKLTTTASGRAILFPRAEGFTKSAFTASTSCDGAKAKASFTVRHEDEVVELALGKKRAAPNHDLDLAFVLDTTGSMSEEIAAVKSTIQKVASSLTGTQTHVRIGLVEYKDRTDAFVTKVYPMSTDLAKFAHDVAGIEAGGGGDIPESVNEGLHVGLTKLDWSGNASVKMAFLIGDAPPHLDYQQDFDYATEMKSASHRGIEVFTVAASGMDDLGQAVWRQIAAYTGATNMFVLRGGAGPQSTGAGDPKSSCGGTQTSYASGNLDALILGKVKNELGALDADPMRIAGLGKDENAKPCGERLLVAR